MAGLPQTREELLALSCRRVTPEEGPLDEPSRTLLLGLTEGWSIRREFLEQEFSFANYLETLSFINVAAWVAHREDHHPEISFGYRQCVIRYTTHSAGGLTINDFICAARISALAVPGA